jgi:glutamine synthetase
LARSLEPPAPIEVDPATLAADERARRGAQPLPGSQVEALDALARDAVLTAALGEPLASSYLAVRRSEWAAYSEGDAVFEQRGHFLKY